MSKDSCKMIKIYFQNSINLRCQENHRILKQKPKLFPAKAKLINTFFQVPWLCTRVPMFTEYLLVTIERSSKRLRE